MYVHCRLFGITEEHVIFNNKTAMPTQYPAATSSSGIHKKIETFVLYYPFKQTTAQFSDDDDVVVKSKLPVPPFTLAANASLTVTPGDVSTLTDRDMSSTRSSSSMDISYENETRNTCEWADISLDTNVTFDLIRNLQHKYF